MPTITPGTIPATITGLDMADSRTSGLLSCILPGKTFANFVNPTGDIGTTTGTPSVVSASFGDVLRFNTTGDSVIFNSSGGNANWTTSLYNNDSSFAILFNSSQTSGDIALSNIETPTGLKDLYKLTLLSFDHFGEPIFSTSRDGLAARYYSRSSSSITANQWNMLIVTYTYFPLEEKIYWNGTSDINSSSGGTQFDDLSEGPGPFHFGHAASGAASFLGDMALMMTWNRIITPTEISMMMTTATMFTFLTSSGGGGGGGTTHRGMTTTGAG